MDQHEINWLADLLNITPEDATKVGVDECTRSVHVEDTKNPFSIAFQG